MKVPEEDGSAQASPPSSSLEVLASLAAAWDAIPVTVMALIEGKLTPDDEHEFAGGLSELARLLHEHAQHRAAAGTWKANGSEGSCPPEREVDEPGEQGQP